MWVGRAACFTCGGGRCACALYAVDPVSSYDFPRTDCGENAVIVARLPRVLYPVGLVKHTLKYGRCLRVGLELRDGEPFGLLLRERIKRVKCSL